MPDLRFAIGAVLACALLIVAVFGLAATVQVAHHRSATPDDPWRTLAFPDPTDWGLLADRSRPSTVAKIEAPEVPQAGVAVTAPAPETTGGVKTSEREAPQDVAPQDVVPQDVVPQDVVPQGVVPQGVPQEAEAPEFAQQPTLDTPPATIVAAVPPAAPREPAAAAPERPVDVVAAIPETKAAAVRPADTPPAVEGPANDDGPLESSERVGALPGFPTAGHGFVPPEHPIALPVPLPPSKPAVKKPQKKKVARSRPRWLSAPPPLANTGYGFDKLAPDSKTDKTTGYDKKWTVE
jgi:hypothetical protein